MYLLEDTPEHRKLIDRYIEVWEYPDGRIELRMDGRVLTCRQYDRLTEVDQAAVVEHKRLGHVLQVSQAIQAQRDNQRIGKAPSERIWALQPKSRVVRRARRNNASSRRPTSNIYLQQTRFSVGASNRQYLATSKASQLLSEFV